MEGFAVRIQTAWRAQLRHRDVEADRIASVLREKYTISMCGDTYDNIETSHGDQLWDLTRANLYSYSESYHIQNDKIQLYACDSDSYEHEICCTQDEWLCTISRCELKRILGQGRVRRLLRSVHTYSLLCDIRGMRHCREVNELQMFFLEGRNNLFRVDDFEAFAAWLADGMYASTFLALRFVARLRLRVRDRRLYAPGGVEYHRLVAQWGDLFEARTGP
jgi:hypothetical protein